MHPCPVCTKPFPSPSKLQRHYVIHTGQKPFICPICGTSLTQSGHLKTHLQKVHPRLPTGRLQDGIVAQDQPASYQKPAAGINARGTSNFDPMPSAVPSSGASRLDWQREHVAHETGDPATRVPHSSDASVTRRSDSHVKDPMTRGQPVSNAPDGYTPFTSSPPLWIQPATRDEASPYESSGESGRAFSQGACSRERPRPLELSSGGRQMTLRHRCPVCLKTFCSPSKLQRHSLIHTGQKPYSCATCRKAFRQKVHLKSHLDSPNKCSLSVRPERERHRSCGLQLQGGRRPRGAPSVELELQCNISVNAAQDLAEAAVKSEAEPSLGACRQSGAQEQRRSRHKSFGPARCAVSSGSVKPDGRLVGCHEMYPRLNELGSPNAPDSEEIRLDSPEPGPADPADPSVAVKPEKWSVSCSDRTDAPPRGWAGVASAERPGETCRAAAAAGEQQRAHLCHACLKCFPSVSKLKRHVMTHTGQRPFGCDMCGKRFRQKTHLRVHCRTHLWSRYHKQRSLYINRPPSCSGGLSRRPAADDAVLEALPRTDLGQTPRGVTIPNRGEESDKVVRKAPAAAKSVPNPVKVQHKCRLCLKCFQSPSKLQRHELVHMGLKLFPCVVCGKSFRQAAHLKTHERTHAERTPDRQEGGEKPRADGQRQPWIGVRIPRRDACADDGSALSEPGGAAGDEVGAPSATKGLNPLKTKPDGGGAACRKRKLHTCRTCFKNFAFPHKLSRHLATHSGARPHKCTPCGKTFTQLGHLRAHEHRCGPGDRVPRVQGDMTTGNHLQEGGPGGISGRAGEPAESRCTGVSRSVADAASSHVSEAVHTEWLAVSEAGSQEENDELEKKLRDCCFQATDHCSYSFPSELSFEMDKLGQDHDAPAPLFPQCEAAAHTAEVPRQPRGAVAVTDRNTLLGDEPVTPLVDNKVQTDNYWCEPLDVFESGMRSASHRIKNHLERHICSTDIQPKMTESARKNRCDICLKHFVSPSKLRRHYLIHTGLRPFRCDICGKTFTQSAHARTHRLTH